MDMLGFHKILVLKNIQRYGIDVIQGQTETLGPLGKYNLALFKLVSGRGASKAV